VASLFFSQFGFSQPTRCYLLPKGIDRLDAFLPLLIQMICDGPSQFVAILTLNLLEVSPRPTHFAVLAVGLRTWLSSHATDTAFWFDHGIGTRACALLALYLRADPLLANPQDPRRAGAPGSETARGRTGAATVTKCPRDVKRSSILPNTSAATGPSRTRESTPLCPRLVLFGTLTGNRMSRRRANGRPGRESLALRS
jgi:hypothetical protein